MKGKIIGKERLKLRLSALLGLAKKESYNVMGNLLVDIDSDAKQEIATGSRSGRTYGRRGVTHTASAAGEFPKTDRGQLIAGFAFSISQKTNKTTGIFENRAPQAKSLEFKPPSQGGRPFMRPIYNKWQPIATQRFKRALVMSIKRVKRV